MSETTIEKKRARTSLLRQNQIIVHDWMRDRGVTEVDLDDVAEWAVKTRRWRRPPPTEVQRCRRELSRALRAETVVDKQGREVRQMHPARYGVPDGPMKTIWAEKDTAKPRHMQISLSQRRAGIGADVRHHRDDHESWNDNNVYGAHLPLFDYDFNKDLLEEAQPTTYPMEKPEDEEEKS